MLRRYIQLACHYPWVFVVLTAVLSTVLGAGLLGLRVEVDPDQQLPQDHPFVRTFHRAHELFGDWNLVVVALTPSRGSVFSPAFLEKTRSVTNRLKDIPGCNSSLLQSIASPASKSIELVDSRLEINPIIPDDLSVPSASVETERRLRSDPSFDRTLVSADFSSVAIYATFELTPASPGYVDINRRIIKALESEADGTFQYTMSGPIPVVAAISEYSSSLAYFFPLALAVIGAVHYVGLRSIHAVILPLLTGVLAVIWALGLMGHLGIPLDPFNSTTAILVLAIGAGHSVQIMKRYEEELDRSKTPDRAIETTMIAVGGVTIATGLIAGLSFLSLAAIGTTSMRVFGVFTGFGILAAVAIEMSLIPAVRRLTHGKRPDRRPPRQNNRFLEQVANITTSRRGAIAVLTAYGGIVLVCAALSSSVQVNTSLKGAFSQQDPIHIADDEINAKFAGTNSLILLVEGAEPGAITRPDTLQGIADLQRELERTPGVGKTLSVVDTVRRLNAAIGGADKVPSSQQLVSQYLLLYSMSGGDELGTKLTGDNKIAKVVILLHNDSTRFAREIISTAQALSDRLLPNDVSVGIAGSLASTVALSDTLVRGKVLNILQISAITIGVSAIFLGSLAGGLLVGLPLTIAVLVNFAVMGALSIPLDITTAAITAMSVGIGADYALYFIFRFREECSANASTPTALRRTIASSGDAILLVSSAVAAGYSILCFSGFRMFVQLGGFVALAMVTSSLSTLFVVSSLLTLLAETRASLTPRLPSIVRRDTDEARAAKA